MARMDHGEAIRLGATEKYVLGELPQSLRDDFEEHYFECQECALDLKAAEAFVDNAREVLREGVAKAVATVPDLFAVGFPGSGRRSQSPLSRDSCWSLLTRTRS
jgi:anti-sigma factor RsiW